MRGVTLDTGVLIGIERRDHRIATRQARWIRDRTVVSVPTVVIAEWWRGQKGPTARVLDAFTIEPTTRAVAEAAGIALAELRLGKEHTIDAILMASAASRGDVVYTSDFDDLAKLATHFASVRVLAV
jgi:predicted nucleic acid-binding protein